MKAARDMTERTTSTNRKNGFHPVERLLCLAVGVLLLDRGLRRGGLDGIVSMVAGSFLTVRGVEGRLTGPNSIPGRKTRRAPAEKSHTIS